MSKISEKINIGICVGVALLILLPAGRAVGESDNEPNLLKLAENKFGTLTKAEEKLFKAVVNGQPAVYSDRLEKNNDPNGAKEWDKKRVIRAECIRWLCTDPEASAMVTHKGVWVKGARIDGKLDLSYARISFPLYFKKSAFPKGIYLRYAEIRELFLSGTPTGPISADGLKVEGDVFLREGFKAQGEVRLVGATIGGDLDCTNGQFINQGAKALSADGMKVEGNVFLRKGFKAEGEVNLLGATIGGGLYCNDGQFINPTGNALVADNVNIKGSAHLQGSFKGDGEVRLLGATIGGDLNCAASKFINKGADALSADGVNVAGDVFLCEGFEAEGKVRLVGATIGGNLECNGGQFINKGAKSLSADGVNVAGNVFLHEGFKANGEVNLLGATIGGNLECDDGRFINKGAKALNASTMKVEGNVFLRDGFKAEGEVNLLSATIGGSLDCEKGQFINKGAKALNASTMKVEGDVLLRYGFKAEGEVNLLGAKITGYFVWADVNSPEKATLDVRSARVGTLCDDANSWPEPENLYLHGLVYNEIDDKAPRDANSRIEWLRRQSGFRPQPYEQLAEVFLKSGQDEDAKKILIAKNEEKAKLTKLTWSEKCWYRVLGPMIGYGYRPLNALWGVAAFVALGWVLFGIGYWARLITPQSESAYVEKSTGTAEGGTETRQLSDVYPRFNFLVYSFDTFVPLIDLHQAKYWLPNANRGPKLLNIKAGGLLRLYLWIHITMGWALTMLLVAGLTGLVRT